MATKKYVSLNKLSTFLDNLKNTFATIGHKHSMSDISDFTVDGELSSTSTNPVQNKVLDEEFESIARAMNVLEMALDGKADPSHAHDDLYYTEEEIDAMLLNKSDVGHTHDIEDISDLQDALDGKSDLEHKHTNEDIKLYDTLISGYETISITNPPKDCILDISLSSDTYTDFSSFTVMCNAGGIEQSAIVSQDGKASIVGMGADLVITLASENDTSDVLITCSLPIDLEKVIKENILHIDEELWDNTDSGDIDGVINAGSVLIDSTLSVSGAAADAKVTGDGINRLNELVGNTPVADQISDAIVEKVFIQHTEPIDAPDGSIWIDLVESGQPNESTKASANVYVVDAGTTDMTTIDFSQFKIGDVVLVTSS